MTGSLTLRTEGAELWQLPRGVAEKEVGLTVCSFLDTATTSLGRATHYNTRLEQQQAELAAHEALMGLSRDVYSVLLALPGVTDRSIQIGMKKLLSTPRNGMPEFLTPANEREILYHMIQALPAQRMLKLLDAFRVGSEELNLKKANNARSRKLILRTVLASPRLQLWAVKYRTKVARALVHAWGRRLASIIREVLKRDQRLWNAKEQNIVSQHLLRFANSGRKENGAVALECVRFVFGVRDRLTLPLLVSYEGAKTDLSAGKKLPPEVLEGIRSTFHKDVAKEKIIELTKDSMSQAQRMVVQKRAKAAGVEVEWDPMRQDAVKLYIHAFECGLTDPVVEAMAAKAKQAAEMFPAHYERVGIVVDASQSMIGDEETQPLRPMATALAMRDMLMQVGKHGAVSYCGGDLGQGPPVLVGPMGDTSLADGLVEVLMATEMPDAVFVISDGYENAPAGRFAEVLAQVRQMGIEVPVYHLNPVFAAEAGRVKELAPGEGVPTLPVQQPKQLGTTFLRGLIEAEPLRGINSLLRMALTAGPTETRKLLQEGR
jgi:hypothetical protein